MIFPSLRSLLFQVDGKLPNYALMRLSTWLKSKGEEVVFSNDIGAAPVDVDRAYLSSIFDTSHQRRTALKAKYPAAIVGGDGYFPIWRDFTVMGRDQGSNLREQITDCDPEQLAPDYSIYPSFTASIGYSARGCRLDCGFCRMKTREGNARTVRRLDQIWRGAPFPKRVFLLDNDFFGQEGWREFLTDAIRGEFKVCFNQGINVRLINPEQGRMLAQVFYSDDRFERRRLYTAWDSQHDEGIFSDRILMLREAGIPSHKIMVYMLIGYKGPRNEPDERPWAEQEPAVLYRYHKLRALGCKPYPMVYDPRLKPAKIFQRWVVRRYHEVCKWEEFDDYVSWKRKNFNLP